MTFKLGLGLGLILAISGEVGLGLGLGELCSAPLRSVPLCPRPLSLSHLALASQLPPASPPANPSFRLPDGITEVQESGRRRTLHFSLLFISFHFLIFDVFYILAIGHVYRRTDGRGRNGACSRLARLALWRDECLAIF